MKHSALVLFGVLLAAFVLRFFQLGSIPNGLYRDETAIGYNAYSLLQTGKDEHGTFLPLYFKSFGDWKLPVYIYATIPFIKTFGMNAVTVRLPSAIFGLGTVAMLYFFVFELTKNKNLALVSSAVLALNPWHIHYSRATFEVSIALFFMLLAGYVWHRAFIGKKTGSFFLGTMAFLVSFWCYNATRLLSPLIALVFMLAYLGKRSSIGKKEYLISALTALIILIPFFMTLSTQAGALSARGTFLATSQAVRAPSIEFRSYMISLPTLINKALFNTPILLTVQFFKNVASYASVPFFFVTGPAHGNHGIGTMGLFYLIELPFFIYGPFLMLARRSRADMLLLLWGAVTIVVASLTRDVPHATRAFFILPMCIVAISYGIIETVTRLLTIKNHQIKVTAAFIILGAWGYNITYFSASYFVRFPIAYAKAWSSADRDVGKFLTAHEKEYNTILIDTRAGLSYSSILFYTAFSPHDFQTATWTPDDREGFSSPIRFGNYEYKEIDWASDTKRPNALIISAPNILPTTVKPYKTFAYPTRPVVLSVGEQIIQYPVQDPAYVLVQTKTINLAAARHP